MLVSFDDAHVVATRLLATRARSNVSIDFTQIGTATGKISQQPKSSKTSFAGNYQRPFSVGLLIGHGGKLSKVKIAICAVAHIASLAIDPFAGRV
jgi:hypothetical protein